MYLHYPSPMKTLLTVLCLAVVQSAFAESLPEIQPILGERGTLLHHVEYAAADAKATTRVTAATAEIQSGLLVLKKRPELTHPGIARISDAKDFAPLTDFLLEADFRWKEKGSFNFQFKKPGRPEHGVAPEYYVSFSRPADPKRPVSLRLADNAPRSEVAKRDITLAPDSTHRVLIEVRNGEVVVHVDGMEPVRGTCTQASAPKSCPDIGFDNEGVAFERFAIWAFK